MVEEIRLLPLNTLKDFLADRRNIWSAESCLRRALEALLDLGRHILAKAYGQGVTEYKQIAEELERREILSPEDAALLRTLAGYRNRLVHFYHEITPEELYEICSNELNDIITLRNAFIKWVKVNPDRIDNIL
jgi:uncharacterized protein YutE (UPF0331/DUF86 family)